MPIFRCFSEFYNGIDAFHRISQFGFHAFQISALGVIPSDVFQVICNHQAVISEKSADQTVFFVVVIITKTVSSCDIVIFLFKDGWIENRNPFNFSCSQILRGEHMCFGPVFFLHVGLVGTHFHEQA